MMSSDNLPTLALSDIMHHMSPSPAPQDEQGGLPINISETAQIESSKGSPEISTEVDVAQIRRRLVQLGFSVAGRRNGTQGNVDLASDANPSSREKELLDMVIRLTESLPADPAQLERQADIIANLTTQRNFITWQVEEERERWRSEQEGWERTAEALLSHRNRFNKSEDIERQRAAFESENRVLRDKLREAHRRLTSLESELMKLKPMLLMQPFSISQPDKGKRREVEPESTTPTVPEERERESDVRAHIQYYAHNHQVPPRIMVTSATTAASSKAGPSTSTQPHQQSRRSRDHINSSKSQSKRQTHPLSSDAYTEHMLLAAKRIGRRRAAKVAGIIQHAEREQEALAQEQEHIRLQKEEDRIEKERQDRVANGTYGAYYRTAPEASNASPQREAPRPGPSVPPRTPKRTGVHYSTLSDGPNINPTPMNLESPLIYMNASQNGSQWAGSGVMGTPGQIRSALNRESGRAHQKIVPSNPPTPLASLLDAALMMDEGRGGSKAKGKPNRKGRTLDDPDSPMPKRRRISSAGKQAASGSSTSNQLSRVKSALDVLADQAAAVVSEPDQAEKRRPAVKRENQATRNTKNRLPEENQNAGHMEDFDDSGSIVNESTSTSSRGKRTARGTRAGSNGRAKTASANVAVSSRPVRQATQKRANSSDRGGVATMSSSTRASGKPRGRPRGSINKSRLGASGSTAGPSRMISSLGPRVIAPPPGYSPLDEALALSSSILSKGKNVQRDRSEEHAKPALMNRPMYIDPQLGLRPVVGWGERDAIDVDSDSSPVRGTDRSQFQDGQGDDDHDASRAEYVVQGVLPMSPLPSSAYVHLTAPSISISNDSIAAQANPSKAINKHVLGEFSGSPLPSILPNVDISLPANEDHVDIDAEAEADDEDAEGEQEEEEGEDTDDFRNHPSRSRSPPPPDPPSPGFDNPPDEDDERDADADADGEMDEENEDITSGSMPSARQAPKGVSSLRMSQPCRPPYHPPLLMLYPLPAPRRSQRVEDKPPHYRFYYLRTGYAYLNGTRTMTISLSVPFGIGRNLSVCHHQTFTLK